MEQFAAALAGRYSIARELGSGGMATVYLAADERHGRHVAIKVLKPELSQALGPERFLREIGTIARLTHPHILSLHDSGEAAGFLYYVMPFIEGESLRATIARDGALPILDALRVMRQVADALAYAHAHHVVHRDIKPDNIMCSGRHALLADFGVAKAMHDASDTSALTSAGIALGTPRYMAPEQAVADPTMDHRVDLYALGVVTYEMLTGHPPFFGPSAQAVIAAHITQAPVPVRAERGETPPGLAVAVMRCLEKDPAKRWQTADALAEALEEPASPVSARVTHHAGDHGEALALLDRRRPNAMRAALDRFTIAIRQNPDDAEAHAGRATALALLADVDASRRSERLVDARKAADRAVELHPESARGHAVLGFVATLGWEWTEAEEHLARAVALAPALADGHHWYSLLLAAEGRLADATVALEHAVDLEPHSARAHAALAGLRYYARNAGGAIESADRALHLAPAHHFAAAIKALARDLNADANGARRALEELARANAGRNPLITAALGWIDARVGVVPTARHALAELQRLRAAGDATDVLAAGVHAALGEGDAAFDHLDCAVRQRDGWLLSLQVHPWLDPLRADDRYLALVRVLGLTPGAQPGRSG